MPPLDQACIGRGIAAADQVEPPPVHIEVAGPADRIAGHQQPTVPVQAIVQLDSRLRQGWMPRRPEDRVVQVPLRPPVAAILDRPPWNWVFTEVCLRPPLSK